MEVLHNFMLGLQLAIKLVSLSPKGSQDKSFYKEEFRILCDECSGRGGIKAVVLRVWSPAN